MRDARTCCNLTPYGRQQQFPKDFARELSTNVELQGTDRMPFTMENQMGLRITRMQNKNPHALYGSLASTSSVWSARDLCPLESLPIDKPTHVEKVLPDANRHLGPQAVADLFSRIWKVARNGSKGILELDMSEVQTTDARFERELGYFRRQQRNRAVVLRVTGWGQTLDVSRH